MAPRKPPMQIQHSALKVIAEYCADSIVYKLENCNATQVRSYITRVRDEVCAAVPPPLFNDFAVLFLQRISRIEECDLDWFEQYGTAVVDVIVDDKLTKLNRYPRVADKLMHELYCKMDRLRKLKHLHLYYVEDKYLSNMKNCNLKHLTSFECQRDCTDEVLRLISERCPNLTTLEIKWSKDITYAGVDVLKRCSNLSMVNFINCGIQADDLIIHLLRQGKSENISHSIHNSENLIRFGAGVYPKLKSLHITTGKVTNADLRVIVRSFRNLNTLRLSSPTIAGDLRLLRFLPHLTSLAIKYTSEWTSQNLHTSYKMEQVESLLIEVGNNYSSLSISVDSSKLQQVVNFVYKTCKNIKYFRVVVITRNALGTITIPPFENLESLILVPDIMWNVSSELQFSRLLALKRLCVTAFGADLESMLLDHDNFPCITEIEQTRCNVRRSEIIKNIIKENNLDVSYHAYSEFSNPVFV